MLKSIFASGALAALLAQTPQPVPQPSPSPSPVTPAPSPSVTPSATPGVTPSPSPSPVASPSVSPSPSPAPPTPSPSPSASPLPTPLPTPLVLPPDAPPQILAVQLSDPVFHGGETVSATVVTSTNVAAVEIRMSGHALRLPRTGFGIFQLSYQVPRVPFWMRKSYTAQVVAMNTAGVEAARDITVSLR